MAHRQEHLQMLSIPTRVQVNCPIQVAQSTITGAGRGMFAIDRDIKAGELIFSIPRGFLCVVQDELLAETTCDNCFAHSSNKAQTVVEKEMTFVCKDCKVYYYCNQKCYEEAMEHHHSAECSILTTIRDDMLSHNISLQQSIFKQALFRGLVRLLSLHRSEKFSKEEWAEVMSLTSKQRIGDKTSDETQEYMSTAKDLKDWTDSSLTPEEITGLIMIWKNNAFGISLPLLYRNHADFFNRESEISVGTCLDPFAALINHSCIPNADWRFEGNTFQLRATQTIKSNDEIFISYTGDASLEGRKELLEFWGVNCCCQQCKEGYPQIAEQAQDLLDVFDEFQYDFLNMIPPVEATEYTMKKLLQYGVETTNPTIRRLWIKIYKAQIAGKEYEKALKTILKLCFGPCRLPSNKQAARITALKGLIGMMETCFERIRIETKRGGRQLEKWYGIEVHVLETLYHHFRRKLLVDTDKCFGADSAVARYEKRLYGEKFAGVDGMSLSPEKVAEILDMLNILLAWAGVGPRV